MQGIQDLTLAILYEKNHQQVVCNLQGRSYPVVTLNHMGFPGNCGIMLFHDLTLYSSNLRPMVWELIARMCSRSTASYAMISDYLPIGVFGDIPAYWKQTELGINFNSDNKIAIYTADIRDIRLEHPKLTDSQLTTKWRAEYALYLG